MKIRKPWLEGDKTSYVFRPGRKSFKEASVSEKSDFGIAYENSPHISLFFGHVLAFVFSGFNHSNTY